MVSSFWISSFSSLLLRVFLLPSLPEYLWKMATKVQRAWSKGHDMIRTRNREKDLAGGGGKGRKTKNQKSLFLVFFSVQFFFFKLIFFNGPRFAFFDPIPRESWKRSSFFFFASVQNETGGEKGSAHPRKRLLKRGVFFKKKMGGGDGRVGPKRDSQRAGIWSNLIVLNIFLFIFILIPPPLPAVFGRGLQRGFHLSYNFHLMTTFKAVSKVIPSGWAGLGSQFHTPHPKKTWSSFVWIFLSLLIFPSAWSLLG